MKLLFLLPLAAGVAMIAGPAFAQDAATPPPPPPPAFDAAAPDMPPPPSPGDPRGPRKHGPADGMRGPGGPRGPGGDGPGKAAHFRLEKGDMRLDVKCAEDEPMQACADIAGKFLDRAMAPSQP